MVLLRYVRPSSGQDVVPAYTRGHLERRRAAQPEHESGLLADAMGLEYDKAALCLASVWRGKKSRLKIYWEKIRGRLVVARLTGG